MAANKFRFTVLAKASLGLPEMQNRGTVKGNLGENGIYVGDLDDTAEATGDLEGGGIWTRRTSALQVLGGVGCYICSNKFLFVLKKRGLSGKGNKIL